MQFTHGGEDFTDPFAHLFFEESQNPTDFLKREPFATQFGDHGNFHSFFGQIDPFMPLVPRRNHLLFIPPLQLPQTNSSNIRDFRRGEDACRDANINSGLFCFEHLSKFPFLGRSGNHDCNGVVEGVKEPDVGVLIGQGASCSGEGTEKVWEL